MRHRKLMHAHAALVAGALCYAALASGAVRAQGEAALPNNDGADGVLRVCADPNNMPLSNNKGEGYENRIASQMASDFGYKLEYTYFRSAWASCVTRCARRWPTASATNAI